MRQLKFIADGMLGKLTRWLRILGYDVEYSSTLSDKELIETAKAEGCILLTRDLQLFQQASMQNAESFFVEGTNETEKLAAMANRFNLKLEVDVSVSRCPKCNTRIGPIPKEKVVSRVPEKTFSRYEEFWECPNCKQVYWQGAHWERINETLKAAQDGKAMLRKHTRP